MLMTNKYFGWCLLLAALVFLAEIGANSAESQILDCTSSVQSCAKNSSPSEVSSKPIASSSHEKKDLDSLGFSRRDVVGHVCGTSDNSNNNNNNNNGEEASLICSPKASSSNSSDEENNRQSRKPVEVFIKTPHNRTHFEHGQSFTIECRFFVDSSILSQDFKFKLRWMKSSSKLDSPFTIVGAATPRLRSKHRDGGLDLDFSEFQEEDAGNYSCKALTLGAGAVISETFIWLQPPPPQATTTTTTNQTNSSSSDDFAPETATNNQAHNLYSQENLSGLLPSLTVIPHFNEVAPGEFTQLLCITSHLDPDPDPDTETIEWSFEPVESKRELLHLSPTASSELPSNVSILDNALIIWSMSEEHCGIYKCTLRLTDFNMSVQAAGELALRTTSDSAPLVSVWPSLVRLPPNGSARVQCEATGYPPPQVVWYRLEDAQFNLTSQPEDGGTASNQEQLTGTGNSSDACLSMEQVPHEDALLYCEQNRCELANGNPRQPITSISLLHLVQARAEHQGQWVCRASNKHGSNQASALIDVEFRDPPVVEIDLAQQTITFPPANQPHLVGQLHNATFTCSVKSGKPLPRLRWLRTASAGGAKRALANMMSSGHQSTGTSLDIYDLTRVSSATSKVSVHLDDRGRSLVLVVGTISFDDEGDYVCLAENEWGRHSALAHLTVRQPAAVRVLQTSPMIARPNDSFHLDCLATGHPAPQDMEWSRPERGAFFSLNSRQSPTSSSGGGGGEWAVLKFDRVDLDDSGEYACNARDPLNGSMILRDTIMVVIDENSSAATTTTDSIRPSGSGHAPRPQEDAAALLPKLMVRPATKITVSPGSNVTLDCLAVSGLQPTVVEWLPPNHDQMMPNSALLASLPSEASSPRPGQSSSISGNQSTTEPPLGQIWPYYRFGGAMGAERPMLQFGSKLRILNVSKQHEGVYQCKGANRAGAENAPALLRVLDPEPEAAVGSSSDDDPTKSAASAKTKVAKVGSNIELKCQVRNLEGWEQPATSWSRDGLELPASSVQIEHNLWIQNVSQRDGGLYVCSARSKQPNKVIQARINLLLVTGDGQLDDLMFGGKSLYNLSAKIVASKMVVNAGDSITLECIVSSQVNISGTPSTPKAIDLEEIERNVIWTSLHSGQSVFQDNVYVQHNLLIIYELRPENSATYRCNYNEFAQHTDYKLQVLDSVDNPSDQLAPVRPTNQTDGQDERSLPGAYGLSAQIKQVALGSSLRLECPMANQTGGGAGVRRQISSYRWRRGAGSMQRAVGPDSAPLTLDSIRVSDADIYYCHQYPPLETSRSQDPSPPAGVAAILGSFMVQVPVPVARFVQRPVSFVSLPSISGANQQLEIEVKFLPERDHGLILFNGQRQQWNKSSGAVGDYISLGLNKGHLEFRFELGDGTTLLRSLQSLALHHWHRVLIERDRRGATMWLDRQDPVSNSSAGKFFNLNLDSVLYVGGNQYFLNKSRTTASTNQTSSNHTSGRFYGYSRGFQGCVSYLRIGRNEVNLIARNRSASIGIYECDKPECRRNECGAGLCQVDHTHHHHHHQVSLNSSSPQLPLEHASSASWGQRCICPPGLGGRHCEFLLPANLASIVSASSPSETPTGSPATPTPTSASPANLGNSSQTASQPAQRPAGACELLSPCASNGTQTCQSLTSTSYRCHCQLGYMGDTCSQAAQFSAGGLETGLWFNQQAYLQLRFNRPEEVQLYSTLSSNLSGTNNNHQQQESTGSGGRAQQTANLTNFARLTSMAESQSISFNLMTNSSYGLIFYMGQTSHLDNNNLANSRNLLEPPPLGQQTSKSMVANLLARLSSIDYLAVALVDGHVELSYELGSGIAIIRSSERVNDRLQHHVSVMRSGRQAKLTIDERHKHEGSSPGKLSELNTPPDMYLGGLPHLAELTHNMYMSGFVGCVSHLQINSLGPLNLIRADHLSQVRAARNLAPCPATGNTTTVNAASGGAAASTGVQSTTASSSSSSSGAKPATTTIGTATSTKHKPYQAPDQSLDSDDPDEM